MADDFQPTVTWLMPVKNAMPYLPQALASIASQTYANWEVLAWDNGSTDGSVEELCRWIPSRLPGRVITGNPLTLGPCRAALVETSRTELNAIVDADDISLPDRLTTQVRFLQDHPDVAVVGAQAHYIDADGKDLGCSIVHPVSHEDIVYRLMRDNCLAQPSVMLRRSSILSLGNYHERVAEDYDLWLRVAVHFKLANIPAPLILYRNHTESITHQQSWRSRLYEDCDAMVEEIAPALFGCSAREIQALRRRRHHWPLIPLWKVCVHLARTRGGSAARRMRSPGFLDVARGLVRDRDALSRLALAAIDARDSALRTECSLIVRQTLARIK